MRWIAGVLLLVGACTIELARRPRPPAPPPRSTHADLDIGMSTLASGLRVVTVRDPRASEVQVTMRYQIGARADDSRPGLAHLVEHLMFQQDLDGQPVFTRLEDIATYFNAETTFDATTYVARGPKPALDQLLAIEATRLEDRCKTLTDAAFARERQVVLGELAQRDQATTVYRAINVALYPDEHPYRQAIGGSGTSVGAITREQACAFADTYYAPNNAVLVVSGPLTQHELDVALANISGRVTRRVGAAERPLSAATFRAQHVEVPAPTDEDVLVLAWPLPLDPQLQANVRAIGAALPRLVDAEIKGSVTAIALGDGGAPLFGLAVVPDQGETFQQVVEGTRRGVARLPEAFTRSESLDEIAFDHVKQAAIYRFYADLEDGTGRDEQLAAAVLAGLQPRVAVSSRIAALEDLTMDDAGELAAKYFAVNTPTVVTLKASPGKKRGDKVSLRAPIHDFGQRRTAADPARANRPADSRANEPIGVKTRVLPNGLKVVLMPTTTLPTFEARLIFNAGTADESEGLDGVALLAAHTITWDLHHLDDAFAFVRIGGMRNADVDTDRTTFTARGLDGNFDVVLAGLRRWVCDGVYDDSASNFVGTMQSAAKRTNDQGLLTDMWRSSLFGANHPYVKAGLVRYANSALTLNDARGYRNAYYTPDNATLVIAGRFDPALADRWIDFLFADWAGHSAGRRLVPATPSAASIAKADDTTLVQMRVAIPITSQARAAHLVAAAMLSDIAKDVRYRLGAGYTFDAALAEKRLASFYVISGFVESERTKAAMDLVHDRIEELHRDPIAAARAFVTARDHVLTQLRSQIGSASALADRVERDIEMARAPLSDIDTARTVSALTIADMAGAIAELDLTRATVLMNGPAADIDPAFAALGRKPVYLTAPPVNVSSAAPGASTPSFAAEEQRVLRSEVMPALTTQPLQRLMWIGSVATAATGSDTSSNMLTGYSITAGVGYRYGWSNAIGAELSTGHVTASKTSAAGVPMQLGLVPIDAVTMWHLGSPRRTWGNLLLGLHVEHVGSDWRSAPVVGVEGGVDVVGRLGITLRWVQAVHSSFDYSTLGFGLAYRH